MRLDFFVVQNSLGTDLVFQLTKEESLWFQNGTLNDEGDMVCVKAEGLRFQNGFIGDRHRFLLVVL